MKISVKTIGNIGPISFKFIGHAPDERYCAALSFFKEQVETHIKYFQNGFELKCENIGDTPYYKIEIVGWTEGCLQALKLLLYSLHNLVQSMNEEYPNSCEYTEQPYKDEEEEYNTDDE